MSRPRSRMECSRARAKPYVASRDGGDRTKRARRAERFAEMKLRQRVWRMAKLLRGVLTQSDLEFQIAAMLRSEIKSQDHFKTFWTWCKKAGMLKAKRTEKYLDREVGLRNER